MRVDTTDYSYGNFGEYFDAVLGESFFVRNVSDATADTHEEGLESIEFIADAQIYKENTEHVHLMVKPYMSQTFNMAHFGFHNAYCQQYPQQAFQMMHRRTVAQGMWELNGDLRAMYNIVA